MQSLMVSLLFGFRLLLMSSHGVFSPKEAETTPAARSNRITEHSSSLSLSFPSSYRAAGRSPSWCRGGLPLLPRSRSPVFSCFLANTAGILFARSASDMVLLYRDMYINPLTRTTWWRIRDTQPGCCVWRQGTPKQGKTAMPE